MIIGGSAQVNNENQFPSQKIAGHLLVVQHLEEFSYRDSHRKDIYRDEQADDVANYFVPAVIFIAISGPACG
jgi:hypothetical protein